jgi:hypothetical protein
VTIDKSGNNAAIENTLGSATIVRPRLPGTHGLISIPMALNLQPFFVVSATSMTVEDGTLILERHVAHGVEIRLVFIVDVYGMATCPRQRGLNLRATELMQYLLFVGAGPSSKT